MSYADTSTTSINLTFVVPVQTNVSAIQTGDRTFQIHEISNNPTGYKVIATTDLGEEIIVSNVLSQTESIDVYKTITIPGTYSSLVFRIEVN